MGCYYTLYLNTYGCSLLFYKVYHEEGECRQLEFWLKRSKHWKPILHCSKNLETPRNLFLELIRIIERKKHLRGATPWPGGWGRPPPYWVRPLSPGPPGGPPVPISCYMKAFTLEKIVGKLTGRNSAATRRNLGGTNLELWRSCSAGDTSLREGEIITNDPLIGRGSISMNIFTSTISSQNPSSSLVSNLVSKPQIGTNGLLVVLITPCS